MSRQAGYQVSIFEETDRGLGAVAHDRIHPDPMRAQLDIQTVYPGRVGDGASAAKERPLVWLRPPRRPGR